MGGEGHVGRERAHGQRTQLAGQSCLGPAAPAESSQPFVERARCAVSPAGVPDLQGQRWPALRPVLSGWALASPQALGGFLHRGRPSSH